MSGFLKGGNFKPANLNNTEEKKESVPTPTIGGKAMPFGKKKLGGLMKKTINKPEETIEEDKKVEEVSTPQLPKKKLGGLKKKALEKAENNEEVVVETTEVVEEIKEEIKEETPVVEKEKVEEVVIEEEKPKKKATKKNTTKKTTKKEEVEDTVTVVDESEKASLSEAEEIMNPIVAPTTEEWEEEKANVLAALKKIKVEQDMNMVQVKTLLAEIDDIKQELLNRTHDVETVYDGTKKNFEAVKTLAIAKSKASNAEGRKAEAIIACRNYVVPSGQVVNLEAYMLLTEEKYKFYQKIMELIDFKKFSLVNYNNALKIESRE